MAGEKRAKGENIQDNNAAAFARRRGWPFRMKFVRAMGVLLLVLGVLALLACAALWLLPQVTWPFTAGWLDAIRAAVNAPTESAPLQWAQAVGQFFLSQSVNTWYLSAGILLLGVSLLLITRDPSRHHQEAAPDRALAPDRRAPRDAYARPLPVGEPYAQEASPRTIAPEPWQARSQQARAPQVREKDELAFMPPMQYSAPVYEPEERLASHAMPEERPVPHAMREVESVASREPVPAAFAASSPATPRELPRGPMPAAFPAPSPAAPRAEERVVFPVCHTLNSPKAYYCHHCKSDLPENLSIVRGAPTEPPEAVTILDYRKPRVQAERDPIAELEPPVLFRPSEAERAEPPAPSPVSDAKPEAPSAPKREPAAALHWGRLSTEGNKAGETSEAQAATPAGSAAPVASPERPPLAAPAMAQAPDFTQNELLTPVRLSARIISTVGVRK